MRFLLIFLLIFSFSCSKDSLTNDSENNGGNTGSDNNNSPGPSGNVFTFGNIDVSGQWDFDQIKGLINNFSEPRQRDININIDQKNYDDSLDVGILNVYPPLSGVLGTNEIITCYVGNYGYLPIFEDFEVSYKIAYEDGEFGEEVFETYTITDSLASVDYTSFDFTTTADLSQFGTYTIEVSTHMPDDMDAETDTFTRVVESLEFTDVCNIHSIILYEENNSFNLYTTNEEGITNYVIFGNYELDEENNMLTLSVNESNGSITVIGHIYDIEIDENGSILGTVNIEGLCVQLIEGYEEEFYYSGLTYIPDENLEAYLIEIGVDDVLDGYIITNNALGVSSVAPDAEDIYVDGGSIDFYDFENRFLNRLTSLAGIEALPNITQMNLRCHNLDSINISQNSNLQYFYANFNSFYKVDTSGNPNLLQFAIDNNLIVPELDFSNNNSLIGLAIPNIETGSYIGSGGYIDVSNLSELEFLDIPGNFLTSIDISSNINIGEIRAGRNNLTEIDISNNNEIWKLQLGENNISEINISHLDQLWEFSIGDNPISSIDFSGNPLLYDLHISNCNLSGVLDVSMLNDLRKLRAWGNPQLTCIKVNAFQLNAIETNDPDYEWSYDSGVILSLDCN